MVSSCRTSVRQGEEAGRDHVPDQQGAWPNLHGLPRQLAREVLVRGPLQRRQLAARFHVSPATLTRTVSPLLASGVLVELDDPEPGGLGRPARLLDVPASTHTFVGIKLTDSSLHAVLTDLRANIRASQTRTLTTHAPDEVADAVASLVRELDTGQDPTAVGISFGGVTTDKRTVARAPFLQWHDVPLAQMVEERTGLPTVLENDLLALTRAEHWFGEGRLVQSFAILTIGIGIGYGLVVHDQVVNHRDMGVGLVAHHPLDPNGPVCPQGHHGCAKAMLTTTTVSSQVSLAHGRSIEYDEVLAMARAGDAAAADVLRSAGLALGRLVAVVANFAMPERIFLSGEGIELAVVAWESVRVGLERDRDPAASPVDVVVQPYDRDLWARGAAAIAIQHHVLGTSNGE